MTDHDALLRAILVEPFDDAPRLVYADWLDDHGQPDRAEFIRVQCDLARLRPLAAAEPHKGHRARVVALWPRAEALLQANHHWAEPFGRDPKSLHRLDDGLWLDCSRGWTTVVRRGFVGVCQRPALGPAGPGWAAFRAHPIAEVRPAARPVLARAGGYEWRLDPGDPDDLRAVRPGAAGVFETADEAIAALSQAYVNFGRSLAGLPPLGAGPRTGGWTPT